MPVTWRRTIQLMTAGAKWLRAELAERYTGTIGLFLDLVAEGGRLAVKAHLLDTPDSPPDALPLIGAERQIDRAPAETEPQYRQRLLRGWKIWEAAGTPRWAARELEPLGVGSANVLVFYEPEPGWDVDNNPESWSRFVIVLKATAVWGADGAEWGDGWTYGDTLPWTEKLWDDFVYGAEAPNGTGKTTWGSSASTGEVSAVRRFLNKRKAGHEVGVYVILDFAHQVWGTKDWGQAGVVYGNSTAHWLLGQFWGAKYVFTVWGDVHPTIAGQPACYTGILN